MSVLYVIFGVTILVVLGLIGWVVWLNWIDNRTENTLGRQFDYYADRPEDKKRFRDNDE